jgi:hypothetical protein
MYYHPMTWATSLGGDRSDPWEEFFDVLVEGAVEQQRLQMEAAKEIFLAPLRRGRELADAPDAMAFAARCFAAPIRSYAKLVELSRRTSDAAAQTRRKLHELLLRQPRDEAGRAVTGADGSGPTKAHVQANPQPRAAPAHSSEDSKGAWRLSEVARDVHSVSGGTGDYSSLRASELPVPG